MNAISKQNNVANIFYNYLYINHYKNHAHINQCKYKYITDSDFYYTI